MARYTTPRGEKSKPHNSPPAGVRKHSGTKLYDHRSNGEPAKRKRREKSPKETS